MKEKEFNKDEENFELPESHTPVMVLPANVSGFSCANCEYVDKEKHECRSLYYINFKGTKKLPNAPLDKICSDWFSPREKK